jgi:hypothetical protein
MGVGVPRVTWNGEAWCGGDAQWRRRVHTCAGCGAGGLWRAWDAVQGWRAWYSLTSVSQSPCRAKRWHHSSPPPHKTTPPVLQLRRRIAASPPRLRLRSPLPTMQLASRHVHNRVGCGTGARAVARPQLRCPCWRRNSSSNSSSSARRLMWPIRAAEVRRGRIEAGRGWCL